MKSKYRMASRRDRYPEKKFETERNGDPGGMGKKRSKRKEVQEAGVTW